MFVDSSQDSCRVGFQKEQFQPGARDALISTEILFNSGQPIVFEDPQPTQRMISLLLIKATIHDPISNNRNSPPLTEAHQVQTSSSERNQTRMAARTILITGSNTGLGLESVKALIQSTTTYKILMGGPLRKQSPRRNSISQTRISKHQKRTQPTASRCDGRCIHRVGVQRGIQVRPH